MASPFNNDVPRRHEDAKETFVNDIFSKFTYVNACPGKLPLTPNVVQQVSELFAC